jgi:hypothetical protein
MGSKQKTFLVLRPFERALTWCYTGREIGDRRTDGRHNDFSRAHFLKMCSKNEFREFDNFVFDELFPDMLVLVPRINQISSLLMFFPELFFANFPSSISNANSFSSTLTFHSSCTYIVVENSLETERTQNDDEVFNNNVFRLPQKSKQQHFLGSFCCFQSQERSYKTRMLFLCCKFVVCLIFTSFCRSVDSLSLC